MSLAKLNTKCSDTNFTESHRAEVKWSVCLSLCHSKAWHVWGQISRVSLVSWKDVREKSSSCPKAKWSPITSTNQSCVTVFFSLKFGSELDNLEMWIMSTWSMADVGTDDWRGSWWSQAHFYYVWILDALPCPHAASKDVGVMDFFDGFSSS